jgi:hypothetical protein
MLRLTMESVTGDGKFFHCSEILTSFEYTLPNQKLVIVVANRHNPSVTFVVPLLILLKLTKLHACRLPMSSKPSWRHQQSR